MQTFKFPSASEANVMRTVTWDDDGKLRCDCPGFRNKRADQPFQCSHILRVTEKQGVGTEIRGDFWFMYADDVAAPVPLPVPSKDERPPKPMLATAMTEEITGAAFDAKFGNMDWVLEEKLDGHRCTIVVQRGIVRAWSRPQAGKPAKLRDDLPGRIAKVMATLPDGIYDGELCAQGGKARNVRQKNALLIFVMFDVLQLQGRSLTGESLESRRKTLLGLLAEMVRKNPDQRAVSTVVQFTPSWDEVRAIWDRGGEGAVLKRVRSTYQAGVRSPDWLKVKPELAAQLRIVGYELGKNGPCSTVLLIDEKGVKASVKTLNGAWLRKLEANPNKYIGRTMVVTYVERTPNGAYQNIRWDHILEEE